MSDDGLDDDIPDLESVYSDLEDNHYGDVTLKSEIIASALWCGWVLGDGIPDISNFPGLTISELEAKTKYHLCVSGILRLSYGSHNVRLRMLHYPVVWFTECDPLVYLDIQTAYYAAKELHSREDLLIDDVRSIISDYLFGHPLRRIREWKDPRECIKRK